MAGGGGGRERLSSRSKTRSSSSSFQPTGARGAAAYDRGPLLLQEPGSYDPFLDADDWYMQEIIKSRKRGQI
jgi:hypothetical protein